LKKGAKRTIEETEHKQRIENVKLKTERTLSDNSIMEIRLELSKHQTPEKR